MEYHDWIMERFEPEELVMELGLEIDEIVEAFPEAIEDNDRLFRQYLEECGIDEEEEDE